MLARDISQQLAIWLPYSVILYVFSLVYCLRRYWNAWRVYISRPFFQSSIHKYANELGAIDIQTSVDTALWLPLPISLEQCWLGVKDFFISFTLWVLWQNRHTVNDSYRRSWSNKFILYHTLSTSFARWVSRFLPFVPIYVFFSVTFW